MEDLCADLKARTDTGNTPLQEAMYAGNLSGMRLLLDKGVHLERSPRNSTHCGQNSRATGRKASRSLQCVRIATLEQTSTQNRQTKQCRKDAVDRSSQEAFFPFGRSCCLGQILSPVGRHGWSSIWIRLSRHLGGQHSAKLVTLHAQPAETTFEVDTNTDSTTDEADLMDIPIKVKQQLALSDNEQTAGDLH